VLGFTRHVAREVAAHGITSNAICPGLIDTAMATKTCPPDRLKRYIESFPIHRLGTCDEVAALVLFLASEEAAYITGASIDINGGDLML
jgi:NAD(P)-dependent dehydrogenase (short-subunit alcohol dehydrogenase family)